MAEKSQNFRTILAEEIYRAAQPAKLTFNLLKASGDRVIHRVQTHMNLIDVATNRGGRGFELCFGRQSAHPLLDAVEAIIDRLHAAGDKANQVFVRLGQ